MFQSYWAAECRRRAQTRAAVRFAREELKLNVFEGDLTETDFPDSYFDFVHINNVLTLLKTQTFKNLKAAS